MYLTKQQLQRIIQEEIEMLSEQGYGAQGQAAKAAQPGSTETFQQTKTSPEGVTKGVDIRRTRGEGGSATGQTSGVTTQAADSSGQEVVTHQSETQPTSTIGRLTTGEQDRTQQRTDFTRDKEGKETSSVTTTDKTAGLPAAGLNKSTLNPKAKPSPSMTVVGESLQRIIQEELQAELAGQSSPITGPQSITLVHGTPNALQYSSETCNGRACEEVYGPNWHNNPGIVSDQEWETSI
jgi:hypothetical protein